MTSERPLVTVAIPTLDRPSYLKETLDSVLGQTWPSLEILISDNASGSETAAYLANVADARVRKFRQETRLGMVAHWNECLVKATGEWFLLLSDDDLLGPHAVELLMALAVETGARMVYSPFVTIDGMGVQGMASAPGPRMTSGGVFIRQHLARHLTVMPSGVLARTWDLRQLGGFPDTGTTSDLGMRLLLASRGEVACLECPVLSYRIHDSNLSGRIAAVVGSHMALLHWAEGRPELKAYLPLLELFTARRLIGCGLRSALLDDPSGVEAAREGLNDTSLRLRPWLIGPALARVLFWVGGQTWFRRMISLRDAWKGARRQKL